MAKRVVLDWSRLLGFDQIARPGKVESKPTGARMTKVGPKVGEKPPERFAKIGAKVGIKPPDRFAA